MSPWLGGDVILAPDKFKGSLTAVEVARHLEDGIHHAVPEATVRVAPVADGGEGTVDAALASGFAPLCVRVRGPRGEPVDAVLAVRGETAIVELAQASGLHHVTPDGVAAVAANTFGTGQLVGAALDAGCSTIVLGLGGSATTDGGAGMVQALGAHLTDEQGNDIELGRGHALIARGVDLTAWDPRLARARFVVASDVDNVLCGPKGAAHVFARQKGATEAQIAELDEGLRRWADVIDHGQHAHRPGAGAAGGVGFAALALLGAEIRPGIDVMLELAGFGELLTDACLVVTGEGSLDEQSLGGKAPVGVARAANEAGVETIAIAGRTTLPETVLRSAGFAAVYTLQQREPDLTVCMHEAPRLLAEVGSTIANDWLKGTRGDQTQPPGSTPRT